MSSNKNIGKTRSQCLQAQPSKKAKKQQKTAPKSVFWDIGAVIIGAFRCGNKPLVLPGVKDGFSKAKTGELKASPKG